MREVRALITMVASTNAAVLITGPSGSGKELVARAIHAESRRARHGFSALNCGAIPADLLESELFGHERGAFTGAISQVRGRFETSSGGTLFLDEIGDMPAAMQVKLLRVLEERAITRVGSRAEIAVDTRIVAATHRDIGGALRQGIFREDLFYRLAVFTIEVPPLAERREDIPALTGHFLTTLAPPMRPMAVSEAGFAEMMRHDWPGNVRELRNFVERGSILFAGQTIGAAEADLLIRRGLPGRRVEQQAIWNAIAPATVPIAAAPLPLAPAPLPPSPLAMPPAPVVVTPGFAPAIEPLPLPIGPAPAMPAAVPAAANVSEGAMGSADHPIDLRSVLADMEHAHIRRALDQANGVVADAARMLSLQRTTLIEKMQKYGLRKAG